MNLIILFMAINLTLGFTYWSDGYKLQCPNGEDFCGYNETAYTLGPNAGNYTDINYYNETGGSLVDLNGTTYPSSTMFKYFTEVYQGNKAGFILFIIAFAGLVGAIGFIPFINRSDISMLSAFFIMFILGGLPTIAHLYNFMNSEGGSLICGSAANGCYFASILSVLFAGVLGFAWLMACLEWWTGRPTS